jgi:hypothetical protein
MDAMQMSVNRLNGARGKDMHRDAAAAAAAGLPSHPLICYSGPYLRLPKGCKGESAYIWI